MRRLPYAVSLALLPFTGCVEDSGLVDDGTSSGSSDTLADASTEAGSGDSMGDGDGDTTGDGTSGDGTSGDGTSGDGTSGDGDGTSGDGTSGDGTTGDGTSGDGDGTSGDGTTGDGTTGDGTTGDGDGTSGDGTTGDGTTGDGTTGDGDGTSGDGDGCFNQQFSFAPDAPNIVLVLDQSGSMNSSYDHDGDPLTPNVSKWNALHIAVTDVLTQYDSQVQFGVQLFPNDPTDTCGVLPGVDVPCNLNNAQQILNYIPLATTSLTGQTPSGEGLQSAINYLQPLTDPGNKAVIFMADGDTNCSYTIPQMEALLQGAYGNSDIPTYVVGINATSQTVIDELNALADAGGVPLLPMMGVPFWNDSFETGDFSGGAYTVGSTWAVDNLDAADGTFSAVSTGLTGGSLTFTDGFETGDLTANAWTVGGTMPWVVDMADVASGTFSAHSGLIGDSQTSDLQVMVNLAVAGTLSFDHRESTESCCDHLQVIIDGGAPVEYDGETLWSNNSFPLAAGPHTILFRYFKDGSVSTNEDRVYLDNITIGEPATSDLSVDANFAVAGNVWFNRTTAATSPDGLAFFIDGNEQARWIGPTAWGEDYYPVLAGNHTLTWQHSGFGAADSVRVDNVRVEEGGVYSTNRFYDAQNTAEFYTALDQILGGLVTCDLVLNPPPPDPNQVDVAVGGTTLPLLDPAAPGFDCATSYGWYYSSLNVATLCGTACTDFTAMAMPTADVTYYCQVM